jgi:hypothetical protein
VFRAAKALTDNQIVKVEAVCPTGLVHTSLPSFACEFPYLRLATPFGLDWLCIFLDMCLGPVRAQKLKCISCHSRLLSKNDTKLG